MNTNFKDSGIAWIGQIPKHWEVIRNKYILSGLYSGGTPTSGTAKFYTDEDYGIPFVSIGDMSKKEFIESTKTKITKFGILDKNLKILPKNTILYSIYATIGEVAELKCSATISQALLALFVKNSYNKQFYKYNLKAMKDYIFFESSGTTQFNLNAKKVLNFSFVLPPLNEQKKIAEFLDKKCEIIDKRLENLERKINTLKEYKKSLVSECVTKGLNPKNMEFKDSGIPWIGQIPKHWEIKKLKYITDYNTETLSENTSEDYEFDYVDIGSVTYENGIEQLQHLKFKNAPSRARRIVKKDDVILSTVRTYLKATASIPENDHPIIVSTGFITFRAKTEILSLYLKYAIQCDVFISDVESRSIGISYPAITSTEVIQMKILVPPLNEQKEIAEFLDKKCEKIDRLNENYTKQIATLKEYKKSLIYECVTGKKEI
ncbi:restriction endonuclease subunit S [Campylobacter porcelli]|uniref:Restriction endonuclease subunit S n=1 Tax=Campylobacter porcelli TaxID=1660073 RepID=A0ABU7M4B7_9BACT|nr:restriction endonuclease subunit S [Campylobacter sp. CX2-4855-23]